MIRPIGMLLVCRTFIILGRVLVPEALTESIWVCGHPECMVSVQARFGRLSLLTLLGHPFLLSIPPCMLTWKVCPFMLQLLLCLKLLLTRPLLWSIVVVSETFLTTPPQLA